MDEVADEDGLRISELHARRFAAPDRTLFNASVFDLLAEQHAVDRQPLENDTSAVEQPDRMPAVFVDGHVADFNVCSAVRPLPDVQDSDQIVTTEQHNLVLACPDESELILAVNGNVLIVSPR